MTAAQWGALWALLNERFGVNKSAELAAFYLAAFSHLTDAEIATGVRKVLTSARFFPSPAEIIEAVGFSPEAAALAEWETCLDVMHGRRGASERLSQTGRKLVALLGGEYALQQTHVDSVPFIRKEWLRLYPHAHEIAEREAQTALPPMTPEGRALIDAALAGRPMPQPRSKQLVKP